MSCDDLKKCLDSNCYEDMYDYTVFQPKRYNNYTVALMVSNRIIELSNANILCNITFKVKRVDLPVH
jgi:hypothetical protein